VPKCRREMNASSSPVVTRQDIRWGSDAITRLHSVAELLGMVTLEVGADYHIIKTHVCKKCHKENVYGSRIEQWTHIAKQEEDALASIMA